MKILSLQKTIASFAILAAFVIGMHPAMSRADEHETELGGKMKIINKSVKALKGQISDATKQQSTIDLLETAKKAADEAKKLQPEKAKDVPEADRAKFIADYQAQMDKLIGDFGKIEDAVKAGKFDDATKLYGDLNGVKREGHEKFQADKDLRLRRGFLVPDGFWFRVCQIRLRRLIVILRLNNRGRQHLPLQLSGFALTRRRRTFLCGAWRLLWAGLPGLFRRRGGC